MEKHLNLKDVNHGLIPDLFNSARNQMDCCDFPCHQYKYIELDHLYVLKQNIVVYFDE